MADEAKEKIVEELHRQARKHYPRRHVYVKGLNDLWQIDLVDMQKYARENAGFRYILTGIDVLSKFGFAAPLRDKTAKSVAKAMEDIFESTSRMPTNIQSDDGKEFFNKTFTALMKRHGINHYSTFSSLKASVVERFNRTLKNFMFKAFGVQGSYRWATNGLLSKLLSTYNNRIHRSIGMKPIEVNRSHEKDLADKLIKAPVALLRRKNMRPRFKVNDVVRISKYKTSIFSKGYLPSWTTELFNVHKVRKTRPPVYTLRDMQGNVISGAFYEQEMQKTAFPNTYLVEKVLKRKGKKVYVKWLGMDSGHNSWI